MNPRAPLLKILAVPLLLAAVVAGLWAFPAFWYNTARAGDGAVRWFAERGEVTGWKFENSPVSGTAEKVLVADRTVNGEFTREGSPPVRVFSAKRYAEKSNEIGLFVHTPDRCWVESGWKIEPSAPELETVPVRGLPVPVERRVFSIKGHRELVFFFGLVGGEPLPYRLDHNLSASQRAGGKEARPGALTRATDAHFWGRLWTSFQSRSELFGPKQFIRISTPIERGNQEAAAERLRFFLGKWLEPADFQQEQQAWRESVRLHASGENKKK